MKHIFRTGLLNLLIIHICTAQSWKRVTDIPEESIFSFAVYGHTAYAGSADRVYIGLNDGTEWHATAALGSRVGVFAVIEFHHKLYAGTGRNGIFSSRDGGASWQPMNGAFEDISSFSIWQDTLYAGSLGNGFYKLNEAAGNWTLFNPDFYTNVDGNVWQVLAIDSTLIAAAGANGIFYKYDPHAGSWDYSYYLTTLAPGLHIFNLLFDSAKTLYAASGSRLTLMRSEDRGRSWLIDNNGVHEGDPVLTSDDQYDYAAVSYLEGPPVTNTVKVYKRLLHAPPGTEWTMTDSLPDNYFYAIGIAGGRLFSARDSGLYYKDATVLPQSDSGDKPFIFPNPAKGQVHIGLHFELPQTIAIRIYDAAGRLVAMPLTNYALPAGPQIITLNISSLARGVYIIDVITPQKYHEARLIVH